MLCVQGNNLLFLRIGAEITAQFSVGALLTSDSGKLITVFLAFDYQGDINDESFPFEALTPIDPDSEAPYTPLEYYVYFRLKRRFVDYDNIYIWSPTTSFGIANL